MRRYTPFKKPALTKVDLKIINNYYKARLTSFYFDLMLTNRRDVYNTCKLLPNCFKTIG